MSARKVSIRAPRLTPEEKATHEAHRQSLVPVTYTVIAGNAEHPTGSQITMLEDPARLKKRGA